MSTIDDIGRRAARDALADAAIVTDVDLGLARLLDGSEPERTASPGGRRWAVLGAVATAAAVVAGLLVVTRDADDPAGPMVPASTPTTTVQPAPTTLPVDATSPPSVAPPSTAAPTSIVTSVPDGLAVSYLDPPPPVAPEVLATVPVGLEEGGIDVSSVAVSPDGGAVVLDRVAGEAVVVAPDGSQRRIALDVVPGTLASAGPGDVVYALWFEPPPAGEVVPQAQIVAIATAGDRQGEIVAFTDVDTNTYLELPNGAFGSGPRAVIDRSRRVGEQLMLYADASGQPTSWPDGSTPPPMVTIDDGAVVSSTTGTTWALLIERQPRWQGESFVGESPPAAGPDGGAFLWTTLGAPLDDSDFSPPTVPVIAVLSADGSGQWYQLTDGWSVAAADVGGMILSRRTDAGLELATVPVPEVAPAPAPPPGDGQSAAVRELAEAIGASALVTREPGLVRSYVNGEVIETVLPAEVFPQGSDGELLWWSSVDANDVVRSTAMTLDGTVVCDVEGSLHRIRADGDGGYVASVEVFSSALVPEQPVPNFAVDCETGERQSIEPITWWLDPGTRFVERVDGRVFEGTSDAEGNARMKNETGVSINGEDYAGFHTFAEGGGQVAYLVIDGTVGTVHASPTVRARNTITGEVLWTTELGTATAPLWWYGDRVLAETRPEDEGEVEQTPSVTVIDAATGAVLDTVETSLEIVYVG